MSQLNRRCSFALLSSHSIDIECDQVQLVDDVHPQQCLPSLHHLEVGRVALAAHLYWNSRQFLATCTVPPE